jgi:signal transduction histidine kinase
VLSYLVARTVTRPLATITATMREVAATGDLTRKIHLRHEGKWDDEDARLLASTFNTLTDSIARFQREAAQRERLSALGRLSTVIAHEIRNPLMIIKAALSTLRADGLSPQELRDAVGDIDEEVVRLNRIVNEVLDFARPIRFEYAVADLHALCRDASAAATAVDPWPPIALRLDPSMPPLVTDAERLRIALVNILANARHAVLARQPAAALPVDARPGGAVAADGGASGMPDIELAVEPAGAGHVAIVVRDLGLGIDAADLTHVFEPYFTTKRSGTGLGLAIAKNIVEGMGGAIHVTSQPREGTEIRIVLPDRPAERRPAGAAASRGTAV